MIDLIAGVVVLGAGGAGLWYFMPSKGQVHPLAVMPLLDSLIPVGIVASLGVGFSMIVAAIANM